jgi:hypothetical protein
MSTRFFTIYAFCGTFCLWLCNCAVLVAQPDAVQPPTRGFTVTVLQGDGLLNPLPRPPEAHLSIRVADTRGQPVHNAVVVFELPDAGASAIFADGSFVKVLLTNERGEAFAPITSNEVPGKYQASITVNYVGQTSLVKLNQENAFPYGTHTNSRNSLVKKRGLLRRVFTKKHVLIALVAAAGAAIATHHGGGASSSQTTNQSPSSGGITITPGSGSVGGH